MSTAGKVLTVIVTLAIIGWIVLVAKVADLNRNWGQEIDRLAGEIQKLDEGIVKSRDGLNKTLAAIRLQQDEKDRELSVLRIQLSKLGKFEAQVQQAVTDVQLQIQLVQEATKDAQAGAQKRLAEREQTKQDLAASQGEVQKLQESVGDLSGRLQRLQSSFIATQQENRQLLQQLRSRAAAAPATVRSASFVR